MIRKYFRPVALGVVFAAGIVSIVATSAPLPPFHFEQSSVQPVFRCPAANVEISWKLSKAAPVTVMVGGIELVTTTADGTMLPAEVLDGKTPISEVVLRIEAEDAEPPLNYNITTFGRERTVEDAAFHDRKMAFEMELMGVRHGRSWDEDIRITSFKVEQIRDLVCDGEAVSPPAWEVIPPTGDPFVLSAAQGHSRRLDPPLPPGRIWRIRPAGGKCRLPASGAQPYLEVRFTAVCVGPGSAS